MAFDFKPSRRTEEAIRHLNRVKPVDGWSADLYVSSEGTKKVSLRRRNAALSDDGFEDIVLDSNGSGCVVGITTYISAAGGGTSKKQYGRGVTLVERDGTVCRTQRDVRVTLPQEEKPSAEDVLNASRERMRNDRERARAAVAARDQGHSATASVNGNTSGLTDEQNMQLLTAAMYAVAAAFALKILSELLSLWLVFLPLAFLYAIQTCPSNESFDAKKELKRVMRGEKLPENHPEKPKDWLSKSIARVTASIGTELATSLGYEVCLNNIYGAFIVATVRVPSTELDFYWIGAFGKWHYLMQRPMPADKRD
eukprot:CAMPEP_0197437820 /NCGR_PEP_ID=MMETSP1175-20131217/4969_1 /TAXON_ID=1003142 /ORGANISM="Triceratium dubium, Strain CCMP147" /LENGTH=310 /DNA_ID=CAMNT_0042967435 /DNA_START=92 /DNA_END=1024 /DNA_ORIENTATION=+